MKLLGMISLVLLLGGCAGSWTNFTFANTVTYEKTAEGNYNKGQEELRDENYQDAAKYFSYVKNKFPFSRFSTLSELRLADAYFEDSKLIEAIDAYRQFQKFHPTHPEVAKGYVAYRICHAFIRQVPDDWFMVPPGHEKDQSAAKDALRELKGFNNTYPNSPHKEEAKRLYRIAIQQLVKHELYVARFYLGRDKPKATILRLEGVLKTYPDAGVDPEVMLLLGKTYLKLEKRDKARSTFARLLKAYPEDPYSEKARLYLVYLDKTAKSDAAARPDAAAKPEEPARPDAAAKPEEPAKPDLPTKSDTSTK